MYAWVLQRLMEVMEKSKTCRAAGMAYCPGKKAPVKDTAAPKTGRRLLRNKSACDPMKIPQCTSTFTTTVGTTKASCEAALGKYITCIGDCATGAAKSGLDTYKAQCSALAGGTTRLLLHTTICPYLL